MGLRIIVADDDRDTVWTLATILRDEGHSVQGVHRGEEVVRAARFLRPDVAVIDLSMPGMSGYAVAQELRNMFYPGVAPLLIAISGTWLQGSDRLLAQHLRLRPPPRQALRPSRADRDPLAALFRCEADT